MNLFKMTLVAMLLTMTVLLSPAMAQVGAGNQGVLCELEIRPRNKTQGESLGVYLKIHNYSPEPVEVADAGLPITFSVYDLKLNPGQVVSTDQLTVVFPYSMESIPSNTAVSYAYKQFKLKKDNGKFLNDSVHRISVDEPRTITGVNSKIVYTCKPQTAFHVNETQN